MTVKSFVRTLYPQAKQQTEIDPIFVVAQAALESGWGKHAIGNNLFGITRGSSWTGAVQLVTTTEYFSRPNVSFHAPEEVIRIEQLGRHRYRYTVKRLFRDYPSLAHCLADHFALLQRPQFADAWPYRKSPELYVRKLVDGVGGKYATDPNYVQTMDKLFHMVRRVVREEGL